MLLQKACFDKQRIIICSDIFKWHVLIKSQSIERMKRGLKKIIIQGEMASCWFAKLGTCVHRTQSNYSHVPHVQVFPGTAHDLERCLYLYHTLLKIVLGYFVYNIFILYRSHLNKNSMRYMANTLFKEISRFVGCLSKMHRGLVHCGLAYFLCLVGSVPINLQWIWQNSNPIAAGHPVDDKLTVTYNNLICSMAVHSLMKAYSRKELKIYDIPILLKPRFDLFSTSWLYVMFFVYLREHYILHLYWREPWTIDPKTSEIGRPQGVWKHRSCHLTCFIPSLPIK